MRQSVDEPVVEILGQAQGFLFRVLRDFPFLALDVTLVLRLHLDLQLDLLALFRVKRLQVLIATDHVGDFRITILGPLQ